MGGITLGILVDTMSLEAEKLFIIGQSRTIELTYEDVEAYYNEVVSGLLVKDNCLYFVMNTV